MGLNKNRVKPCVALASILHPNGNILLTADQQGHKMAATRRPQGGAVHVKEQDATEMVLFQITAVFMVEFQRTSAHFAPR